MKYQLILIQLYYQFLSIVSPKIAFKKASILFQTVRKKDIRPREMAFFEKATHSKLVHEQEDIDVYTLGEENKKLVVLLHGWDSNAGSMSMVIDLLIEKKYKVITMNLPGHAFAKGNKNNYYRSKNAFLALLNHIKPQESFHIVSHSFGSGVVAGAISEGNFPIDKLIFLTGPNKLLQFFEEFKAMIKLGDRPYKMLCDWASELLKEDFQNLQLGEKLQKTSFNHLLIIHDRKDKVLSYSNAEEIHKLVPNSTIDDHVSVGHYRMLWNKEVLKSIDQFLD